MKKPGIQIEIPGFGNRDIRRIVSDYTGTLSFQGKLSPGVRRRMRKLMQLVDMEIITSDSYGTAGKELKGLVVPYLLRKKRHDLEKQAYVKKFNLKKLAVFGNGNNDRFMLRTVKRGGGLAIAVDNGEGCAIDALRQSTLIIRGAVSGRPISRRL
jgi:soluble P-type ATPase